MIELDGMGSFTTLITSSGTSGFAVPDDTAARKIFQSWIDHLHKLRRTTGARMAALAKR